MSLKILAPVSSLKGAELQIKAGADEIYVGLEEPKIFRNLSFSGGGKGNNVTSYKEFKKIIKLSHENGVLVNYAANIPLMVTSLEEYFLEYVEKGVEAEVDTLILGDIGSILLIKDNNIDIPIVASVFNNIFNLEHVKLLKDLKVSRIVFPHKLTLEEMREITSSINGIKFEVFGHFGCSNIIGKCQLLHYWGESVNFGLICRGKYAINVNSTSYINVPILDAGTDCTICSLTDLAEIGIDIIKIVGRDKNPYFTSTITRIYRNMIDQLNENTSSGLFKNNILEKEPWWGYWCNDNRCKYRENEVIRSYI